MARDNEHCEGGDADTDPEEDIVMADEKVLPVEQENGVMIMIDQNDQAEKRMEEEMEAAAIELEDLFALMQPEAFVQFPDFLTMTILTGVNLLILTLWTECVIWQTWTSEFHDFGVLRLNSRRKLAAFSYYFPNLS
ncbi:hypothetical protein B9Z19DRAFT_1069226 [Tuber borchii]|uniref:Uncharacterized protein n=1 Tax=Tuber borchii TaxID=42251 RepID=A0A2T6ZCF8_TUBBO|nr:hypothetical protein B9Z19DRAFT_1069226 [Tuber borchii]